MDRRQVYGALALLIIILSATTLAYCQVAGDENVSMNRETIYQVSTIDALQLGVFDGILPVGALGEHGDFGIGTFEALDGEMIVLEGVVYHAMADGRVRIAPDEDTTPSAAVTYFDEDFSIVTGEAMNFSVFSAVTPDQLPTRNMIYAVRVDGTFPVMKVRAIPAQQKPYPSLSQAVENQSVFISTNITGTIVGFYFPVFLSGLNVEGYHLHFISDDRETGGHILDFIIPENTLVSYDITPEFTLVLPTDGDFLEADFSQDLREEVARAET